MRFVDRFDVRVRSGPFTPLDLGVYRIVFAVGTLCVAPSIRWLDGYPDAMYAAPPGPFQLISGFPSSSFLVALEILRIGEIDSRLTRSCVAPDAIMRRNGRFAISPFASDLPSSWRLL